MLSWTDNAYASGPRGSDYRVYSASYDLDQNLCGANGASRNHGGARVLVGALINGRTALLRGYCGERRGV